MFKKTPRDRYDTFEPQIVEKRQTLISEEIKEKIIRLYAKGMSVRDICDHIDEIYGLALSPSTLSAISGHVVPQVREWPKQAKKLYRRA